MHISEFDYDLPEDLIAQEPLEKRDASRMLVVERKSSRWIDSQFASFVEHLRPSDVVVINNTRVIPARLIGQREGTGGRVEIFLIDEIQPRLWNVLLRPGNRLHEGSLVVLGKGLTAEIMNNPGAELRRVRFHFDGSFDTLINALGITPLPPYIKRPAGESAEDRERYQTIYSKQSGAIAAPTAGLHFTTRILDEISTRARLAEITLHVGYGTFEPVRVEETDKHAVSPERFEISSEAALRINEAKKAGGRVIAVGTTTVRALESAADESGNVTCGPGSATITITPGYRFRVTEGLLTNFHLPRSSLLLLVSAFAGRELILKAYRHAVSERYRFYSYGDCMLIL